MCSIYNLSFTECGALESSSCFTNIYKEILLSWENNLVFKAAQETKKAKSLLFRCSNFKLICSKFSVN